MDARGNKLSSCKIPDQYLKKQKSYQTFRTLATLTENREKIAHTRVFYNTRNHFSAKKTRLGRSV